MAQKLGQASHTVHGSFLVLHNSQFKILRVLRVELGGTGGESVNSAGYSLIE